LSPVIELNSYARFDTTNEDDSNYRSNPSQNANIQSRLIPSQHSQHESLSQTQSNTQYLRQQILPTSSVSSKQVQESQVPKKKVVVNQLPKQSEQQQQHNLIISILGKVTRTKKISDQNWSILSRDEIKIIWKLQRQRASKISNYPSNEKMITEV